MDQLISRRSWSFVTPLSFRAPSVAVMLCCCIWSWMVWNVVMPNTNCNWHVHRISGLQQPFKQFPHDTAGSQKQEQGNRGPPTAIRGWLAHWGCDAGLLPGTAQSRSTNLYLAQSFECTIADRYNISMGFVTLHLISGSQI